MTDQYNNNTKAENYNKFNNSALFLKHITVPSIRRLLGDLSEKRCVDLACGSGQSTQILADLNAKEVIGIDLSPHMVDLAIKQYSSNPNYSSRMRFLAKDCSEPIDLGLFDLVFSMHFLNYAESKQKLSQMVRTMFEATRPGGDCIGLIVSPFMKPSDYSMLYKYGVEFDLRNGRDLNTKLYNGEVGRSEILNEFNTYLWEPIVHEESFSRAGFKEFEWVSLQIDPNYDDSDNYLTDFINAAPNIIFKAKRLFN